MNEDIKIQVAYVEKLRKINIINNKYKIEDDEEFNTELIDEDKNECSEEYEEATRRYISFSILSNNCDTTIEMPLDKIKKRCIIKKYVSFEKNKLLKRIILNEKNYYIYLNKVGHLCITPNINNIFRLKAKLHTIFLMKKAYIFGILTNTLDKNNVFENVYLGEKKDSKVIRPFKKWKFKHFAIMKIKTSDILKLGEEEEKIYVGDDEGNKIVLKKLKKLVKKVQPNVANIKVKSLLTKDKLFLIGFLLIRDKRERINRDNLKLELNEKEYDIKFIFTRIKHLKFLGILSNLYFVKIPYTDLMTDNIHNTPYFKYIREEDIEKKWSLRYSVLGKKKRYLNSKIKMLRDKNTSIYVRQTAKNRLCITVREINKTDEFKEQLKVNIAWLISKLIRKRKIIMYEKHSERYEESASILYENLIDQGYKNIYYIINRDNEVLEKLDNKYKKNIIYKNTFKHYLFFFSSKGFIGTESPGHAIELRIANKHAARRIYNDKFKYVFLQHGVMYMVSLDSKGRSFFRKNGGMPANSKVVVSSKLEADHFRKLGGFRKKDLYITGLPKFDKNKYSENADKIVIMLTWRPWEYNELRNDIYNAPYYILVKKIIDSIPDKYKEKVILMPHPLALEALQKSELAKYILDKFTYDEVLMDTKLLITDYSSIAYDAFYRGSNVIFYWEEKDYCMEEYGGHLMLNDDNSFGSICYNENELKQVIEKEYTSKQSEENIEKYREIVEFSDNNNTKRLIELLKIDKII